MQYYFDEKEFEKNFDVKSTDKKSADSSRLHHRPNNRFNLFPYKASGKRQAPIVTELEDVVSALFRLVLEMDSKPINYDELCQSLIECIEIDKNDEEYFKDLIYNMFFKEDDFVAKNIGLYVYQTKVNNRSADDLAKYLYDVLKLDIDDCAKIKDATVNYSYNVLERMILDVLASREKKVITDRKKYFVVVEGIQHQFRKDFQFMIQSGMTSLEDLGNLLAVYYFYYVSQTCIVLDQFGEGKRDNVVGMYFALDWERVSKNRKCCTEGWEKLQKNIHHMFSHAITLEILNQHRDVNSMYDYILFQDYVRNEPDKDDTIAAEIKKAERAYVSYVGDYKKFDQIVEIQCGSKTDQAMRHLFQCVDVQFLNTERKRAYQFYSEKFSEFCKARWLKNRKKSGLVLNLTERDIIFLTKISLQNNKKIRLNDLYKEYEQRGIYLDNTSKEYLQDFFTKLNLIDKKSDSGDAQYVKRIL